MNKIDTSHLVSVIMPAYNCSDTISLSIGSILNQTYKNLEIIIIDDGSFDNTLEIAKSYSYQYPEIRFIIISQKNSGAASARNTGILNSSGMYIAFLDSDDEWYPTKIEEQILLFKRYPEVFLVGSLTNMKNYSFFNKLYNINSYLIEITYNQMLFSNRFQTSTVLIKKEVFNIVGVFPTGQRHAEEGDLFLRITYKFKSILINKVLVNYSSGKSGFGESGLSSNLTRMWLGELKNYYRAYKRVEINFLTLIFFNLYSFLKFLRRLLLR